MFGEADLTLDGFLGGRLRILQPRHGYRAATDPVLLAAAVPARTGQSVLELGCGVGVASFCLGARVPGLALSGVEVQADYADLARRNAVANGMAFSVFDADLAALPSELKQQRFDHVILNPPYLLPHDGTSADNGGREQALREATPLAVWLDVATSRLLPGGYLSLIQLSQRLADILAGLDRRMGSIEIKPLTSRIGRSSDRLILRARKGGRAALKLHAPLILHEGSAHRRDGDSYNAELQGILRQSAALRF
ncbi:MAG: methyltransferase [Rhodobacteraceae bacterium]|nr:methyltransferase [Paracoccaceae bacterium]